MIIYKVGEYVYIYTECIHALRRYIRYGIRTVLQISFFFEDSMIGDEGKKRRNE